MVCEIKLIVFVMANYQHGGSRPTEGNALRGDLFKSVFQQGNPIFEGKRKETQSLIVQIPNDYADDHD